MPGIGIYLPDISVRILSNYNFHYSAWLHQVARFVRINAVNCGAYQRFFRSIFVTMLLTPRTSFSASSLESTSGVKINTPLLIG